MKRVWKLVLVPSFAAVLTLLTAGFTFAQATPGTKLYIPQPAPNATITDGTKVVTTTAPHSTSCCKAKFLGRSYRSR